VILFAGSGSKIKVKMSTIFAGIGRWRRKYSVPSLEYSRYSELPVEASFHGAR